jgi:hypothetical protein
MRSIDRRKASPQLVALDVVLGQPDRTAVGGRCPIPVTVPAQELGVRRGQRLIVGERRIGEQRLEEVKPGLRVRGKRHGRGTIDFDHRGRIELGQRAVQGGDLRPLRCSRVGGLDMEGGDRRLQLESSGAAQLQCPMQGFQPFGDRRAVPEVPVLTVQGDVASLVIDACLVARVVEQHQRQQPPALCIFGHQLTEQSAQTERLGAELPADEFFAAGRGVALIEDQIDDLEDAADPSRQLLVLGDGVGDMRIGDFVLGPHDALAHRRLGHKESACDLAGRQAADCSEGESDASRHVKRRVTAGEDQPQAIVGKSAIGEHLGHSLRVLAVALDAHQLSETFSAGRMDETTFEGSYYEVRGAVNQPKGVQQPHIPMLIAGGGEKVTLKLVAQHGDLCNIIESPAGLERKFAILREHCEAAGRDYDAIRRTSVSLCALADSDDEARAMLPEGAGALFPGDVRDYGLIGTVQTVRERLARYEAAGVQELAINFIAADPSELMRRYASEFVTAEAIA